MQNIRRRFASTFLEPIDIITATALRHLFASLPQLYCNLLISLQHGLRQLCVNLPPYTPHSPLAGRYWESAPGAKGKLCFRKRRCNATALVCISGTQQTSDQREPTGAIRN